MSELGNKLRDARIEKGYTLNTLQQKTKIQKKYLQAIEEGHFDELPGSFYLRAFIKQYADMVGLDGDALLIEYEEELTVEQTGESQNESESDALPTRSQRYEEKEKNNLDILMSYLPLIILIAIVLAIMIALVVAINNVGSDDPVDPVVTETTNEVISLLEPETVVEDETTITEETTETELNENDVQVGDQVMTLVSAPGEATTYELWGSFDEFTFEFEGNSFVWVGAFEDGVIVMDTTVNEGETISHQVSPGVQEVRFTLGYPEGADFVVNGVTIEPEGQFLRETIIFRLGDPENQTIELDLPEEEVAEEPEEEGPQGPQVLEGSDEE